MMKEDNRKNDSTALELIIVNEVTKEENIYYHFDDCVDEIMNSHLIIRTIEVERGCFRIYVSNSAYALSSIADSQIDQVEEMVRLHHSEFRMKTQWRGRTMYGMSAHGLRLHKWKAYAYLNKDGSIAAYADYKIRMEGRIEIGIMLTDERSRGEGLSRSLLWLFRLKYPMMGSWGGTFEENTAMRRSYMRAGYVQEQVWDEKMRSYVPYVTCDRIDPKAPEDKNELTNSVYYEAEKLMVC